MRLLVAFLALVLFVLGCSSSPAPSVEALAFLIGGQSNAVGHGAYQGTWPGDPRVTYFVDDTPTFFGPNPVDLPVGGKNTNGCELGLGPFVADAHPGQRVVISKSATDSYTIAKLSTGVPWSRTVRAIAKLRQFATSFGYVLLQGEADTANPVGYLGRLQTFAAMVRAEFGVSDPTLVRFYIVLVNIHDAGGSGLGIAGTASVRADEEAFVASDPNAVVVGPDDIVPGASPYHYSSPQEIEIGERVGEQVP